MTQEEIRNRILTLKQEKRAVILAHYYARPEVQALADYVGDSLGLSEEAARVSDADIIVFCGVHFMAETAAIISPDKKVLIPVADAGCTLAEGVAGKDLAAWKQQNPEGLIVSYVNTTADVKAHSDYCCTSSNALAMVRKLPADRKVLFCPDHNLGAFIRQKSGRDMELWHACCYVHQRVAAEMIYEALEQYPDADILVHPEVACSHDERILNHPRVFFSSTAGMIRHAKESEKQRFVIATEVGIFYKLQQEMPDKVFIPIREDLICEDMKKVTLENLLEALEKEQYVVKLPKEVSDRALLPIRRMWEE